MTRDSGRDIVIIMDDARSSGFCGKGMAEWGTAQGMSVKSLSRGEYTVGSMEDLNDAFANRIAASARKRVSSG